jgi:hypothetical protein
MANDPQQAGNRRRGPGFPKGVSGNPRGGALNADRRLVIVADLSAQLTEATGKPVGAASACLISRIATLMTAKGDPVRSSRAVADLLRQLGFAGDGAKPEPPRTKTLAEHLAERRAAEAAGHD